MLLLIELIKLEVTKIMAKIISKRLTECFIPFKFLLIAYYCEAV